MLTRLQLKDFKGFREAELQLGPLSLLIGANASGKSNLRDAFRFLHGISRGYILAEVLGEKYGESGYREWSGIRGGAKEICRSGTKGFGLSIDFQTLRGFSRSPVKYTYTIEVITDEKGAIRVKKESLYRGIQVIFDSHPTHDAPSQDDSLHIAVRLRPGGAHRKMGPKIIALSHQPVLTQITSLARTQSVESKVKIAVDEAISELEAMRFVDFVPDAMRRPSLPGQTVLGDQGENLSSVLQAICEDKEMNESLRLWITQLTPMDVVDFDFVPDSQGKILVHLKEADGRKVSAISASDGTLRFLGILAAFLGPKPARFYFLEEVDTGIHPARLFLLMNLLEQRSGKGGLQIFTTTHSPQMLRLLGLEGLDFASLAYRVEGVPETRIRALQQIPGLIDVLKTSDIARLYEGGWMEQTMFFDEGDPQPFELDPDGEAEPVTTDFK